MFLDSRLRGNDAAERRRYRLTLRVAARAFRSGEGSTAGPRIKRSLTSSHRGIAPRWRDLRICYPRGGKVCPPEFAWRERRLASGRLEL